MNKKMGGREDPGPSKAPNEVFKPGKFMELQGWRRREPFVPWNILWMESEAEGKAGKSGCGSRQRESPARFEFLLCPLGILVGMRI